MKRQRRKRTIRRRGLTHIGDVLASILTEVEQDEVREPENKPNVNEPVRLESNLMPIPVAANAQSTFAFYQPAEV